MPQGNPPPVLTPLGILSMMLYITSLPVTHEFGCPALPFSKPRQVHPIAWLTTPLGCSPLVQMDSTPNLPPADLSDCVEGICIFPVVQTKLLLRPYINPSKVLVGSPCRNIKNISISHFQHHHHPSLSHRFFFFLPIFNVLPTWGKALCWISDSFPLCLEIM